MKLFRTLAAGIVGGVLMFATGAVTHMFTPIGEMGLSELPAENEQVFKGLTERGAYFVPGGMLASKHLPRAEREAAEKAWTDRYTEGPRGLVIFDPEPGVSPMTPRMLGTELASNCLAAFFAAMIVGCLGCTYAGRVAACVGFGVVAWLSLDLSYWNWYRFPWDMTVGSLLDQLSGWLVAGLGIAAIAGRCKPCEAPPAAA